MFASANAFAHAFLGYNNTALRRMSTQKLPGGPHSAAFSGLRACFCAYVRGFRFMDNLANRCVLG
jgi:hypothetical protein